MCFKNIHNSTMQFKVSKGNFYAEKHNLEDRLL